MPRYNVSVDLLVPVLLEVEADNEDAALDKVFDMPKRELLKLANTENDSIGIINEDVSPGAEG